MPRSRARSSRDSIFRDTPTWSTVGMNTRKRPGIVTCEVRRAPLVPSGSLTTCTRISSPSLRSSSIFGLSDLGRRLDAPPFATVLLVVARFELLELLERVDDFGDVEKAVALETRDR